MKYKNAAEVLPASLLTEIQRYINGEVLYIPTGERHGKWGEKNGSKQYYENRNRLIKLQYKTGDTIDQIAVEYGLAYETVRKVVYKA